MSLLIRLLGPSAVERDGQVVQPAGCKTWALLAHLLLVERPPSRCRLAELFYPQAEDPRAALRWSLADLRRLLGPDAEVSGDPVRLRLPEAAVVDARLVLEGSRLAHTVAVLDGEVLEGLSFPSSAPLDLWLACERQRVAAACRRLLHAAADDALHNGDAGELARLAGQLIVLSPFEAADAVAVEPIPVGAAARPHG